MPLAVTNYDFSVFLHVTAVDGRVRLDLLRVGDVSRGDEDERRNLPYVHRMQLMLNQFFALPAVVVVAATGIYQMDKGDWDYGDFWVSATITILVVIAPDECLLLHSHRPEAAADHPEGDGGRRRPGAAARGPAPEYQRWGELEGSSAGSSGSC